MSHDTALRPHGFGGTIDCWRELLPQDGKVLRLPVQGVRDGPFLRIPGSDVGYDVILVESLTESLGNLEAFVRDAAGRLAPRGALMIDMENLAAPRSVRFALEGRPGAMDPAGSSREPERRIHRPRVLAALAAAGLVLEDVYEVPSPPDEVGPEFARTIFHEGFLALSYLGGPPPARLWIVARRHEPRAGTVLIGAGAAEDQGRTLQCVQRFLPEGWQVLICEAGGDVREVEGFNRGIVQSQGDLLWFLRAGTLVDRRLFDNLVARTVLSPAAPAGEEGGELLNPGDLAGLMVQRTVLFQVGVLPREWHSDQIAYEDWHLRLETTTQNVHGVAGSYTQPAKASIDLATFAAESKQLIARWAAIDKGASGLVPSKCPRAQAAGLHVAPWQGRKPRISLCMIVKDEESFLEQCLRSAAACVDEMVIVDTGSTDRTVEIARTHGATVHHFKWCDDFAAARNFALTHASGDWILSLDADEVLAPETPAKIRVLVQDPAVAGYHLRFWNHHAREKTLGVIMVRLFRNLRGLHWVNRIHEQITPSLAERAAQQGLVMSISDAEVEHHGYMDDVMNSRRKNERNDRLFRMHLQEHPDDVYMLYKYGDFLRRHTERWGEAKAFLQQAFDLITRKPPSAPRAIPFASEVAALLALEQLREGSTEEAERIVEYALQRFMPTPNLHYITASLALARGDSDEAIHHYERCLSYRDQVLVVPIQEGITSHVALTGIAQAWMQKGCRERALHLLLQSQRIEPRHEGTALALSRLRLAAGDTGGSLTVLTRYMAINPESAAACQQASLILSQLGMEDQARGMRDHAVRLQETARRHKNEHTQRRENPTKKDKDDDDANDFHPITSLCGYDEHPATCHPAG